MQHVTTMARRSGAGVLIGAAGLVLVVGPSVVNGRIPGDIGDARFISYILEHFFRWVTGADASFWNADFFYPFPLTTAFGDNFLGNAFVYAIFRSLGLMREDAFRLWYVAGFALNFAAADYALVRLGYSRLAASLGAFLFTFGLPVTAQESHAQLIYRFGVPLAILALEDFRSRKQLFQLVLVAFWTTWQFYCSIYIGYFLCLLLLAMAIGHTVLHPGGPLSGVQVWAREAPMLWTSSTTRAKTGFLLALPLLAVSMALLLMPYLEVGDLYGFHRPWLAISSMLPRPASYLLANNSRLWPSTGRLFEALPMRHEHAMFIGIAPLVAVVIAITLRLANRARLDTHFLPTAIAVLLLVLVTLWIHGTSAYRILTWLPGVDAIRAVTRIITVLLFPCGVIFASSLDAISTARLSLWARSVSVVLLAFLAVFESCYVVHHADTKRDWQERLAALAAELPRKLPEAPILLLAPKPDDPAPWARELDAMLFAQDHGWRTLNGYSGNDAPRPELAGGCQDAAVSLVSGLTFAGRDPAQYFAPLVRDVLMVGYPPCDPARSSPPQVTGFSGPLPAELMGHIKLTIEQLSAYQGRLVVRALITNNSTEVLPAYSKTGMPVRLSPRCLDSHTDPAELEHLPGWYLRQPVGFDVPPGSSRPIEFSIGPPKGPGTYRLALSVVQEGVAWFHDFGMQIPFSRQTVQVTADHSLRVSDNGN